ncbi:MAG: LamG-like jellyroll fold domain-containing protein [Planctomycetota bacterium]
MKTNNSSRTTKITLAVFGLMTAIVLGGGSAKADFIFGEPTNMGPTVNSSVRDFTPSVSADSLTLYFSSNRPGGHGNLDIWVATRPTMGDPWEEPMNMGPTINTSSNGEHPSISLDGLTLFFSSNRPGGYGERDLWVTTRSATSQPWSEPVNLGPTVNSSSDDVGPSISADGLELYFQSTRSGGQGYQDTWVTSRTTTSDPWAEPVNLGPYLNSPSADGQPDISANGLILFFRSRESGINGSSDIWFSKRATVKDDWGMPVHLAPPVNTTASDSGPSISADGSILYFHSRRTGGLGDYDLWQVPIIPIADLNGDGTVDSDDMCLLVDHWHTNNELYDIAPLPFGDDFVDVQDLIFLSEHLFEEVDDPTLMAHWALDETDGDIAQDSAGDNFGLVVGGPVWQPAGGQLEGALQLDGVDDVIIAGSPLNPADGPFSILAWIQGGAPGQAIISESAGPDWLSLDPVTGHLMTELTSAARGAMPLQSQAFITDGNWHRIGFVWDGLYRTLYVDGIAVAEDTQPGLKSSNNDLYIGTGKDMALGTYWSGLIDDVRIYNRAIRP